MGETIGLTWDDVSIPDREVVIDHQLIYKKRGDGFKLYVSTPKTDAGIRTLHMTQIVKKAFLKQREYQMAQGPMEKAVIDGKTNFIFTGRNGLPMMPSAVNNVLYNIVDAYNEEETARAKKERRKPVLLPKISCHINGLQNLNKRISTHHLTVLTISVILTLEQTNMKPCMYFVR